MSDRIPRRPTDGWMLSELERRGVHLRGTTWTTKTLVRLLRERGFDIDDRPAPASGDEVER